VERRQAGRVRRSQDVFRHAGSARVENWDRHEVAPQPFCSEVSMADLVPVHIRYGDKNGVVLQQSGGILCGNHGHVWSCYANQYRQC
jgi:hypothetical protein